MNIPKTFSGFCSKVKANSPLELAFLGFIGLGCTIYFVAKETPKAEEAIEEEAAYRRAQGNEEPMNKIDICKVKVKPYTKSIISAAVTVAAFSGSTYLYSKNIHGLKKENSNLLNYISSIMGTTATYKELVKDEVGEEKEKEIEKKAEEKKVQKAIDNKEYKLPPNGDYLVYEPLTGERFYSREDKINFALIRANKQFSGEEGDGFVSLADIFKLLDYDFNSPIAYNWVFEAKKVGDTIELDPEYSDLGWFTNEEGVRIPVFYLRFSNPPKFREEVSWY